MKDETIFIEHIKEAIENIEEFTRGVTKNKFFKSKEKQYAVIRAIEIMGEATKNISTTFRNRYPDIPWTKIAGMRDRLIYHYFGVNLERVWEAVKRDFPTLKKQIKQILDKSSENK